MKKILLVVAFAAFSLPSFAQKVVEEVPFDAEYYDSGDPGQYGIIVLTGSAGGHARETSNNLVKLGYNVLSLSYFDRDGSSFVPGTLELIPLEYLEAPRKWLAERTKGVVLYGLSKGAEFALAAASFDDDYKAIIALAPSKVVWQGIPEDFSKITLSPSSWSRGGVALPFVPYMSSDEQKRLGFDNRHKASMTNNQAVEEAVIKVENIKVPTLLLSGGKDMSWPATEMANDICARMSDNCTHLNYPEGDHLLSNYEVTFFAEVRKFLDGLD